jgi:hypothetical protein
METLGFILLAGYIFVALYIKPPKNRPIDVFKLNTNLLPYWSKFISLGWIAFVIFHAYFIRRIPWVENNFLLVGVNFGLVVICFSKSRNEDEFSMQIRWKSMYTSVITLFGFFGFAGAMKISVPNLQPPGFYYLFMILNATLLVNIIYYYFSKYRLSWSKKS